MNKFEIEKQGNEAITRALPPTALGTLIDRGDASGLAMAVIDLPAGKLRQEVFGRAVDYCIQAFERSEINQRNFSKSFRAIMKLDDTFDPFDENYTQKPRSFCYIRKALERLNQKDENCYGRVIRSLPVEVVLSLGKSGLQHCSVRQAASMVKSFSYPAYKELIIVSRLKERAETGYWRNVSAAAAGNDNLFQHLDRLSQVLEEIVDRDEPGSPDSFSERVIASLLDADDKGAERLTESYVFRPILFLAKREEDSAMFFLQSHTVTALLAARVLGE